MDFKLTDGVDLHIISTPQFKTNQILINFSTQQSEKNITARSLVADLLETSTHKYPTQTALARQTSSLFGAYVGTNVGRYGNLHALRVRASFVNDQYAVPGLTEQVISLLHEMIFQPLIDNNAFDEPTFNLQRNNLRSSIQALDEDKQFYAAMKLREIYFADNSLLKIPSFGRLSDLDELTPESLVETYRAMVTNDRINIIVLGNVDEKRIVEQFKQFEFQPREAQFGSLFYQQELVATPKVQTETQVLNQSKLNLAYQLPIYYQDADYYASLVMNGILGGSPLSKLFVNVREKASLAYYANSQPNAFNGLFSIQTGIQSDSQKQAQRLIKEQVTAVIEGEFTAELLQEVKDGIINQYETSLDVSSNIVEQVLLDKITNTKTNDLAKKINQVTTADVMRVAAQLKLQATYYLNGDLN
ncbi:peptidase M16 [Paucilactobacillus hokkaidonensis JCM 18461]|uniref:Peptidase M16 n=2 Tax=Paucilactobacillus hokkaidonensis TaxID=1193095 RepID=A0A0A1GUV3_9LACO|nr:pitrilysin family protein [Paucilactobacillus hokkaidonensis]KRO10538.1 peptidase M16 inactive domain-containing protein [Paucilactobacillus hokkaidonensis]BAP86057.1 peptidase M16 [Paucilactobacillus hokkaidonensis JCM 18461]